MRSQYAKHGAPRSLVPDAVFVAPATYNTINKWAQGISDTYALGVLVAGYHERVLTGGQRAPGWLTPIRRPHLLP